MVNVDLRRQLKLDKRLTDLCLFAVAVCIVLVGLLFVIVGLLHLVDGLLRGMYWAWDSWVESDLFVTWIEIVPVVYRSRDRGRKIEVYLLRR